MGSGGNVETRRPPGLDWSIAVAGLLGVALIAPVIVIPGMFFPYVVPRNILFRVAVELAAAACVFEILLRGKRLDLRREHVLFALGSLVFALALSAVFSPARSHSTFGDFERMGGVWAWLHLALFVLVLRTLDEKHFDWLLHLALAVCAGASIHAIMERGWMGDDLTVVGNSGLFAGYALPGIGISLYLAIRSGRHRPLYLTAAAVEVVALLVSQNRSSVLGLLVGAVAGAMILGAASGGENKRWIPMWLTLGTAGLVASLIALVRLLGGAEWTSRLPGVLRKIAATDLGGIDALRAMQWEAALAGFRDRPLVGFGPENYHLVWSAHFDPRSRELGAEVFDRTHNQYLEMLATTGIVGALAFAGIWLAIGYSLYRAFTARGMDARELAVLAGSNIAYATYLVFWFVDVSAAMLWLLLAALIARRRNPVPILSPGERRVPSHVAGAGVLITAVALAFSFYRHAYAPARASFALAALDSPRAGYARASAALDVISASSAPQTSHFGPVISNFIDASIRDEKREGVRRAERTTLIDRAFETAISAYDAELRRDPLNDRLHTGAAELLMDAAEFYGSTEHLERAIRLLERAVELSPLRSRQQRLLAKASSDLLLLGGEEEIRR